MSLVKHLVVIIKFSSASKKHMKALIIMAILLVYVLSTWNELRLDEYQTTIQQPTRILTSQEINMFDRHQFRSIITEVLDELGYNSESAVNLLMGTAAQESRLGTYLMQVGGGPAQGVFQMEPTTEHDIWYNYIMFKPWIEDAIKKTCRVSWRVKEGRLKTDLAYQIAMARIHYLRVPAPLPDPDDIEGLAEYWKRHYNTPLGRGTTREFIENYERYAR